MTTASASICPACSRYRIDPERHDIWTGHPLAVCDAFPDGIPSEILEGGFDHREPFEGDGGVRFNLGPEMESYLRMYEEYWKRKESYLKREGAR